MVGMRFESSGICRRRNLASGGCERRRPGPRGGTDLLVKLRADMIEPELVVDIKRIAETRTVTEEDGGSASARQSPAPN